MSINTNLHAAKRAKKDEFYTQLVDIENELRYYQDHFKGKIVYCNCDDPRVSNFFHYFSHNFERLGLKRLITSCYQNTNSNLFSRHFSKKAVWLDYRGPSDGERVPNVKNIEVGEFEGDGDFRSEESIALLEQADIVVTNPPFSLFREYVAQLIEYDKKFLIIGNMNAITYKEIFPLIRKKRTWLGVSKPKWFVAPPEYRKITGKTPGKVEDGRDFYSFGNVNWFTNLDHKKRYEELILYKRYSPEEYPTYDNYNAINVNKVADIPEDYDGVMGVPITFLDRYNPDQFEILGIAKTWFGAATKTYPPQVQISASGKRSQVTKLNDGPVLRINGPIGKTYYMVGGYYYRQIYARILIRRTFY